MLNNPHWFTESYSNFGCGFGLQVHAKVHEEQTPFCKISLYETTHFGYLMTIDDVIMLTSRDNFLYHEMLVHPALFTHPHPRDVVIIGGGDCGTLKEVLKHPVNSVTQIEIDERVTRLAEIYFPELCSSNNDPRANLVFADGIQWMKTASAQSVDIIIVDSTDPVGPAEGLFNQAFYTECHRVLKKDGILVHQSESPLIHLELLRQMRTAMTSADFSHLLTIPFPQPVYPSGWWSCTLAAKQPFASFRQDQTLLAEMQLKYYHFPLHQAALTPIPFLQTNL